MTIAAKHELRRVDEAKSYFLATISHELRTPLTSIMGYLEILQSSVPGPLTKTQVAMLDSIDRNTAGYGASSRTCSPCR